LQSTGGTQLGFANIQTPLQRQRGKERKVYPALVNTLSDMKDKIWNWHLLSDYKNIYVKKREYSMPGLSCLNILFHLIIKVILELDIFVFFWHRKNLTLYPRSHRQQMAG
jgi:hypothetical protein